MAVIQTGTNAYTFYFDKNVVNFNEESIDYPILFDTTDDTKFYYIDENDNFIEYTPQMGFSRVITFHNNLDTTYEYSNTFIISSYGQSLFVYIDNNNKVWTVSQLRAPIIATNVKGFRLENVNFAENQTLESINSIVNPYIGTKTSLEPHTNLTNTTRIFKDSVSTTTGLGTYNINFTSNGENFVKISTTYRGYTPISYYKADGTEVKAFDNSQWTNQAYRTITITSGADVENDNLIRFLNVAGTQKIEFIETKTALKIYEDLSQAEYDVLEKEPNTFYLVNGKGVYKGDKLIANNEPDPYISEQVIQNDVSFTTAGGPLTAYFRFTTGIQGRAYVLTLAFYDNTGNLLQQTTPLLFFLGFGKSEFEIDGGINVGIGYSAPGMSINISGTSEYIDSDTKSVFCNIFQLTSDFKDISN